MENRSAGREEDEKSGANSGKRGSVERCGNTVWFELREGKIKENSKD